MSDTMEYIDSYFNGALSPEEQMQFENRCIADQGFAEEVAFYISARDRLRTVVHAQKKNDFHQLYHQLPSEKRSTGGLVRVLKPLAAVAAACLLLFAGWQLFRTSDTPARLADDYIQKDLSILSVQMGNGADSLQQGIGAYNEGKYEQAEALLKGQAYGDRASEAHRYLGIVYLRTNRYDQALVQFEQLATYRGLFVNPGLFYEALTLMKRSAPGDEAKAKQLLEQVVQQQSYGSAQAAEWLKKL